MRPSYQQYEQRRMGNNGNSMPGILYMFKQSFFADSFRKFWQNWNPLFSYYLLFYCYKPVRRLLPKWISVIIAFGISGVIHDIAAIIALSRPYFLFTLTFVLFGLFVILEGLFRVRLTKMPAMLRPAYHISLIVGSFFLSKYIIEQF